MPRSAAPTASVPVCYAITVEGLEKVATAEIKDELHAELKRTAPGLVVFRPAQLDRSVLGLRTVEDVFLLLWGTDRLTYRAVDLDYITEWTAKQPDWVEALRLHHCVRPKPRGKPTYHVVTQMHGQHGYRRADAAKALARGLAGKFPSSWRPVEENADLEVWLTIDEASAVCGLRLSDRTMRHRTYKAEHVRASLRPVVAAAMVRLARTPHHGWLVDPMCGAGTILAERLAVHPEAWVMGGDIDPATLLAAQTNLHPLGKPFLARWDARQLPLRDATVDRLVCNPPFGLQLGEPEQIASLYRQLVKEWDRVLKPDGRAVLLVSDASALELAARTRKWKRQDRLRLRLLGQPAFLTVWVRG
jgi:23S rRNA G2445 N2-methylase RlmL